MTALIDSIRKTVRSKTQPRVLYPRLIFMMGLLGLVFYAVSPIIFPNNDDIRQPELLPVYTLMMGLGELMYKPKEKHINNEHDEDSAGE